MSKSDCFVIPGTPLFAIPGKREEVLQAQVAHYEICLWGTPDQRAEQKAEDMSLGSWLGAAAKTAWILAEAERLR